MDDFYEISLNDEYFRWLIRIIGFKDINSCKYISMLTYMYSTRFELTNPVVGHDDNRLNDGFDLRADYSNGFSMEDMPDSFGEPVSILEVLVAFARRIDDDIMYDGNLHASKWFFLMIDNLGMIDFTDDKLGISWNIDDEEQILDRMMSRQYDRNGVGGLFPIKNSKYDQREIEIWYQMQEWFYQNN